MNQVKETICYIYTHVYENENQTKVINKDDSSSYSLDVTNMTVTSVPCQVVRSTTQVYFNIRIDQKRRRAIHFCEECRYYGRYCDAIHKGREIKKKR